MKYTIRICQGVSCKACLSDDIFKYAEKLLEGCNFIDLEKRHCMNMCNSSPNMEIVNNETGENIVHKNIDYNQVEEFIENLKKEI